MDGTEELSETDRIEILQEYLSTKGYPIAGWMESGGVRTYWWAKLTKGEDKIVRLPRAFEITRERLLSAHPMELLDMVDVALEAH